MNVLQLIPNLALIRNIAITIVVTAALTHAYSWHNAKVKKATESVINSIQLDMSRQSLKLFNERDNANIALTEKVNQIELQKQKQMRIADAKYNSLLAAFNGFNGLSERPKTTSSTDTSNDPTSTSNTEATTGVNFGRLYREDAIFLAGYARSTEEIKIALLSCYKQYDQVKLDVAEFEAKSKLAK